MKQTKSILTALLLIWSVAVLAVGPSAQQTTADSLQTRRINALAADPNFVQAYILQVSPGKAFYSTYGHAAIRMVCPSKKLDYCFSFEMDMGASSHLSILTRTAHSGYLMLPTAQFLAPYGQEGRGVIAWQLNLLPWQKQKLWRFLDKSVAQGSCWTFNYTTVNCLSMVLYALHTALQPEKLEFSRMPGITRTDFGQWQDDCTARSPWVRLLMHAVLAGQDGSQMSAEDKLTPGSLTEALPYAVITDSDGLHPRSLILGHPQRLLPQTYQDAPCPFRPWMAFLLLVAVLTSVAVSIIKKKRRNINMFNLSKKL